MKKQFNSNTFKSPRSHEARSRVGDKDLRAAESWRREAGGLCAVTQR